MNSDSVILIAPPYITVGPNSWSFMAPIPIESDVAYHLRTSFQSYQKVPFFEPKWSINKNSVIGNFGHTDNGKPFEQEIIPVDLDFDSIDECFDEAIKVSDTVNFIFAWNIDPKESPNMDLIFSKIDSYRNRGNVRIIAFIPDAWPRGLDLIKLVESHVEVCDKIIVLYDGLKPFLINQNRKDLADKLYYFPFLPMVLNDNKNKKTDFCYIGAVAGSYEHRGIALDLIQQSFPEKNFFVYTQGKTNNPTNYLSKTKDFVNKLGESKYSIVTSTCPTSFLNSRQNEYNYYNWTSVLPGRLTESIINMTIPVYVQFSKNDRMPKEIDDNNAWIYIQANDTYDVIREKIQSVHIEQMKVNMMRFYEDYISPEKLIPKLLERTQ
jgi:hypothetical protein